MQKNESDMLNKTVADSRGLTLDQLQELIGRLEEEVRNRQDASATRLEMAGQKSAGSICYQLVKTRCGKKECKCARGELHGPYWYACFRENGKNRRKYVGKTLPDSEALLKFSERLRKKADDARTKSNQRGKAGRDTLERVRKAPNEDKI
jgi:hypothetical protein